MTDLDELPFDSAARAFVDAAEALRDALEEAERAVDATAAPTQAASDTLTALSEAAVAFSGEAARSAASLEGGAASAMAKLSAMTSEYAVALMQAGLRMGQIHELFHEQLQLRSIQPVRHILESMDWDWDREDAEP